MQIDSPLGSHKISSSSYKTFTVPDGNNVPAVKAVPQQTIVEGSDLLRQRDKFLNESEGGLSSDQKEKINTILGIGKIFAPVEIDDKIVVLSSLSARIRKDIVKDSAKILDEIDRTYYIMTATLAYSIVKIIDITEDWKSVQNKYWIPELNLESKQELLYESGWMEDLFTEYTNKIQRKLIIKSDSAELADNLKK